MKKNEIVESLINQHKVVFDSIQSAYEKVLDFDFITISKNRAQFNLSFNYDNSTNNKIRDYSMLKKYFKSIEDSIKGTVWVSQTKVKNSNSIDVYFDIIL